MKILGLHINGAQSAAALIDNGEVVCGIAEERLNRNKQSNDFPRLAARWCLDTGNLETLEDLDAVAISWNPSKGYLRSTGSLAKWRGIADRLSHTPENLASLLAEETLSSATETRFGFSAHGKPDIYYIDHHISHLAMATYQSPYQDAAVLIADEYSESNSFTFASVEGDDVKVLKQIGFPHSLGIFYATFTEYLGFRPNSDEWKVMGAAAYGDESRFSSVIRSLINTDTSSANVELDLNYFEFQNIMVQGYSTQKFDSYLGVSRPKGPLEQEHYDLAASVQKVFEDILFELLTWLHRETGIDNLVAAGGCFMNSLANGKITSATPFKNLFVPYAAADNGGAVGSALWAYHQIKGNQRLHRQAPPTPLIGPSYQDSEIVETLDRFKISFEQVDDIVDATLKEILDGKIIGWFQGAMEFGERALGSRSILADPRSLKMKDHINSAVKYREAFRPFAPSILEHRAEEWFDMPVGTKVPYMEQVYPFRLEKRDQVPAVVHNDGTGRLQTVSKAVNPIYFDLIERFEAQTGVPILLNTSFNVQGEPIVCSPADAIRTFYSSGIDVLVMGNCIVRKN